MEALRESISSLESEVLHEAVLANVDPSAEDSTVRQMRLASHQYQKELIDEEAHAAQSAPRLTAPALVVRPNVCVALVAQFCSRTDATCCTTATR